jgi:mRNA interferase RelE/StbE
MRRLRIPDEVAGLIRGLHPELKRKVRTALDDLCDDPALGKPLREELAGLRTCRVARFRIIYRVVGTVIAVVAVGPRQTIYEETWKKVRRSAHGRAGKT